MTTSFFFFSIYLSICILMYLFQSICIFLKCIFVYYHLVYSIYLYIYIYIYIYIYMCVCVCVCVCMLMYLFQSICIFLKCIFVY